MRPDSLGGLEKVNRAAERRRKETIIGYGIRNDQLHWVGIWTDRATAELVLSKGVTAHGEHIVPLIAAKEGGND